MEGYNQTGERREARSGYSVLFIILGFVCAVASLMYYPFIFGVVGVILGILASKGGSRAGVFVIAVNILFMAIGLIFGGAIQNNITHLLGI